MSEIEDYTQENINLEVKDIPKLPLHFFLRLVGKRLDLAFLQAFLYQSYLKILYIKKQNSENALLEE